MGRGIRLSDFEKGQISAYHSSGMSSTKISKVLMRSQNVISNYLKNIENYGQNYRKGRPLKTTLRERRLLLKEVVIRGKTIMEAKRENELQGSKSTLFRVLQRTENIKYLKSKSAPKLTNEHKVLRLEWAQKHMIFGDKWREVIFTDEKKFNLDGPDGYKYYWHDLRRDTKFHSKRAFGGGSLMVWAGIGWSGRTELVIIDGRMNSEAYKEMLKKYLIPFTGRISGQKWTLQQDNCSVHTSKLMQNWFETQNIDVLDWPSLSPDLNIIENVWGELVRRVYGNGRQFRTVEELKSVLIEEWEAMTQTYLQTLFNSMNNRLFEVIRGNGKTINY